MIYRKFQEGVSAGFREGPEGVKASHAFWLVSWKFQESFRVVQRGSWGF